jgi:DNA-binding NarL/FixJ family response regulator
VNKTSAKPTQFSFLETQHVLIADDHSFVRDLVSNFLLAEGALSAETAADFDETKALVKQKNFDILLLDYQMPGITGIAAIQELRTLSPETKILIFSGNINEATVSEALSMGAVGYIPKTMPAKTIISILSLVQDGQQFLPASFLQYQDRRAKVKQSLSAVETETLRKVATGATNKEIARDLNITETTVKMHLRVICQKLDVKNRTQAALLAHNYTLVD